MNIVREREKATVRDLYDSAESASGGGGFDCDRARFESASRSSGEVVLRISNEVTSRVAFAHRDPLMLLPSSSRAVAEIH